MATWRILIADDKPLVRAGIRLLLEQHADWSVCGEAADGVEAVEQAVALKPDVILLDLSMPRLDGLSALPLIRQKAPSTAVVIVTLHQSLEVAKIAAGGGAAAYLTKSLLTNDLVPALENIQSAEKRLPEDD